MFEQFVAVAFDVATLVLQEAVDRVAKLGVRDPVAGPGQGRQETAAELVFALCAGIESGESLGDAIFDTAVITALEMEVAIIVVAAPDPAVEVAVAAK